MELKQPRRKRFSGKTSQSQSLPVLVESVSGITACNSLWPLYVGTFSGDSVIVSSRDEMSSLYNMGFFGKGCLSRGYPIFGEVRKGIPPFIRERQWKRRKLWMDQLLSFTKSTLDYEKMEDYRNDEHDKATESNISKEKSPQSKFVSSDFEDVQIIDAESGENIKSIKRGKNIIGNTNISKELHKNENQTVNDWALSSQSSTCRNGKAVSVTENSSSSSAKLSITLGPDNVDHDRNSQLFELATSENNVVIVIDDSESDEELQSPKPRLCQEPIKTAVETLNLTLEEAFFLSFGLGCLQVVDLQGIFLSLQGMWRLYKDSQSDFVSSYVTYHYFRSKGWVVKPGSKFGGNFLLYKQGPPLYHASYVVIIEDVNNKSNDSKVKRHLSWTKIMGLNRITETAGKEILLSQVQWPENVTQDELNNPLVISKFKVQEVLLRRWNSEHERNEKEQ